MRLAEVAELSIIACGPGNPGAHCTSDGASKLGKLLPSKSPVRSGSFVRFEHPTHGAMHGHVEHVSQDGKYHVRLSESVASKKHSRTPEAGHLMKDVPHDKVTNLGHPKDADFLHSHNVEVRNAAKP